LKLNVVLKVKKVNLVYTEKFTHSGSGTGGSSISVMSNYICNGETFGSIYMQLYRLMILILLLPLACLAILLLVIYTLAKFRISKLT